MQNGVMIKGDLVTTVKVTNALALYPAFPSWKFTLWLYQHTYEVAVVLSVIVRSWKHPTCPSGDQITKLGQVPQWNTMQLC